MNHLIQAKEYVKLTTTTNIIADVIGKEHSDVLMVVRHAKISGEIGRSNFGLSAYVDEDNIPRKNYTVTEDGCNFILKKLTSSKLHIYQEIFAIAFQSMRNETSKKQKGIPTDEEQKQIDENEIMQLYNVGNEDGIEIMLDCYRNTLYKG